MSTATARTVEAQYDDCLKVEERVGRTRLGVMTNQVWHDDPRRMVFLLARYKFVAKMFEGLGHVLEVGCGDAFGTRVVQQSVDKVTALDIDPLFVDDIAQRANPDWPLEVRVHDMLKGPFERPVDGVYSLDVIEHIPQAEEDLFLGNIARSLKDEGSAIIGMPSLASQDWASPQSKAGHINCKHGPDFKQVMERHFTNVFLFSMNDEVVHTGFWPMAHYYLALACGPRR